MTPEARAEIDMGLASADEDVRWHAAILAGEHVEKSPDAAWEVAATWGCSDEPDVRMAIATCVLEHLLGRHFHLVFPRVAELARRNPKFADTFLSCWKFGESEAAGNAKQLDELRATLRRERAGGRTRG